MNYGKIKSAKTQKKITSKSVMNQKRAGVYIFKLFVICILLGIIAIGAYLGVFVKKIADDTPTVTPDDVSPTGYTSFVYDQNGVQLDEFVASGSNRVYKTLDEIPVDLQHAFVAVEDERFYEHNGIDIQGIVRAAASGITSGGNFSQGASTLTQQLIKNNIFTNFTEEKTMMDKVERKIQEQILAVDLEKQMSKDEVLEDYLNTINLGQNTLGVQAAANRYFNKDVSELTLSESAVIAGITQNPSRYNPITNPEDNAERRTKVLKDMMAQKYITQEQYDEAMADDVYSRIQNINIELTSQSSTNSYFIDALSNQLMSDLQSQLNYTETQAYNAVYKGGLSVTATIDTNIQQICDEEANNDENYPYEVYWGITSYAVTVTRADGSVENYDQNAIKSYALNTYGDDQGLLYGSEEEAQGRIQEWKDATLNLQEGDTISGEVINITPQPQASVVVMDQATGQVKAIVGGRGAKAGNMSYDRATDAKRQPGSCFKVLSTYAPALDACGKTLATTIKDEEFYYDNGTKVHNWWGDSYKGDVTVRKAIEQSMNVCAVKMLTEITPQLGYNYLLNFGITTLVKDEKRDGGIYTDVQQSLALGGITDGITNLEISAAYATIANRGIYNKPIFYTQIKDHDGNILLDNTGSSHQVLKDSTAYLLTSAMEDVVSGANGTGRRAQMDNMPVSGKTGTTTSNKDIWFCAFTPYYTCSVWGGYDDNKELNDTTYHLTLWKSIMDRIHANLPYKDFEAPASVQQASICTQTGLLPNNGCPTITEFFAIDTIPTEVCPGHYSRKPSSGGEDNSGGNNTDAGQGETTTTTTTVEEPAPGGDTGGGETGGGETGGGETGGGETGGGEAGGGEAGGGEAGGGTP